MKRESSDDDELVDIPSAGIGIAMAAMASMLSSCSPSLAHSVISSNPKNATALIRAESSTVTQLKDLGIMEDDGCVLQKECHKGDHSSTVVMQSDEELTVTAYETSPPKHNYMNNNVKDDRHGNFFSYRNSGGCSKKSSANSMTMAQVRPPGTSQGSDVADTKNNFAAPLKLPMAERNESSGTSGVVEGEKMVGKKGNSALYGLRRNPKRSRKFFNQMSTVPPKKTNSIFSEKARACTECGKEFSSWKALFGHMRCHPEREWRGILPPQGVRHERDHHHIQQQQQQQRQHQLHRAQVQAIHRKRPNLPRAQLPPEESESELEERIASYKLPDDDSDTESIETAYLNGTDQNADNRHEMTEKRSKLIQKPRVKIPTEDHTTSGEPAEMAKVTAGITTATEIMEQRDMAHCLVMLSSAGRMENESAFSDNRDGDAADDRAESTESAKLQWEVPMSPANKQSQVTTLNDGGAEKAMRFECGTCKKVFRSHQALGGHRASHKKVKGCFAITNENQVEDVITAPEFAKSEDYNQRNNIYPKEINPTVSTADHDDPALMGSFAKKGKGGGNHQCSICFRVFSTGQALGGHKRCHWGAGESTKDAIPVPGAEINNSNSAINRNTSVPAQNNNHQPQQRGQSKNIKADLLDLNLPAPAEDEGTDQSKHSMSAPADELELRLGNGLDAKRGGEFPFLPDTGN